MASDSAVLVSAIHATAARRHLTQEEAREAMRVILRGDATEAQIGAFLMALHMKGETADELAGFARALREQALPVPYVSTPGEMLLDTCGTGGDGHNTFNISTTVAFVAAGCGIRVAKHGNRAASGLTGSADVLEQLGVTIAQSGQQAAAALSQAGICFLFAPAFHPALRFVQGVRRELKMRTAFNLLGPLANPAPTRAQLVGTNSLDSAARVASALAELELERGFVLHGEDGLDEVALSGPTTVFEIRSGFVRKFRVAPEDFGISRAPLEAVRGGDASQNARITLALLDGVKGPCRDIVLANAAMALVAAQRCEGLTDAVQLAEISIDSGAAREKLKLLAELSKGHREA